MTKTKGLIKPYRPSNGTEGCWFDAKFCENCRHDSAWRRQEIEDRIMTAKSCKVLMYAMGFDIDDSEDPKEWIYDKNDEPTCTKFSSKKNKQYIKKAKSPRQIKSQGNLF